MVPFNLQHSLAISRATCCARDAEVSSVGLKSTSYASKRCSSPGHGTQEGPTSSDLLQEPEVLSPSTDQGEGQGGWHLELFRPQRKLSPETRECPSGST